MRTTQPPTPAEMTASVAADLYVPIEHFYTTVGARTKFIEWQQMGLRIVRFNNRRCVRPSELRAFQEKHAEPLTTTSNE